MDKIIQDIALEKLTVLLNRLSEVADTSPFQFTLIGGTSQPLCPCGAGFRHWKPDCVFVQARALRKELGE